MMLLSPLNFKIYYAFPGSKASFRNMKGIIFPPSLLPAITSPRPLPSVRQRSDMGQYVSAVGGMEEWFIS